MVLDPLAQINVVTMVAIIVIFLATSLLLRRIFFLPLIEVMEQRAARIAQARERKADVDARLHEAQLEAERVRAAAAAEAARLVEQAASETAAIRSGRMARAAAEAEAILANGREEVRALRQAESAKLEDELRACVTAMLSKMVGTVDDVAVRLTVKRALATKEAG
jgi:F-type H+-transporting ATPase subunit b